MILIAVIALCLQWLAPYLVWPSRWNIPTHISAGFCLTAYVIPGLLTDVWSDYSDDTISMFARINALGAIMVCLGIVIPAIFERKGAPNPFVHYAAVNAGDDNIARRLTTILIVCVIGIYISYLVMGFVPLLADDPLMARQFRGIYRDPYYRVAYLYRFTFSVLSQTMALTLMLAWVKRSRILVILAFLSAGALFLSLSRGPMAAGLLMFLGVLAAGQRAGMKWYFPLVTLIFPLGSIFFFLFGQITNTALMGSGDTLMDHIAGGAPDISDQMLWLRGFMTGNFFTYGRTIFGGLVPGNYPWNPGVWTVSYTDVGTDVTDIASGGLRLTTAEWGYANFGWFGVVLIPLVSGLLNGLILVRLRKAEGILTSVQMTMALLVYATLGSQIVNFFVLSIHNMPAIATALYLWHSKASKTNLRPVLLNG